jgi:predicted membrane protein
MINAILMLTTAFAVVSANILLTKLIFGRGYEDASKREKNVMDVLSLGVMVGLFLIYIVLISNL